jgi:transmembrane sensor
MRRHAAALEEIDELAARWVARRDAGLSGAEQVEFDRWCSASALHREAVSRFEATWSGLARPARAGVDREFRNELHRLANGQRRRRIGAVASLAVVMLVATFAWRSGDSRALTELPPVATHSVVIAPTRHLLPDGSTIEYPKGSTVAVDYSGKFRRVRLSQGEAHFAVAKDPSRPFIVEAGGVEVRAVGTAFSVQLKQSHVDVLVTEGRVAVEKAGAASVIESRDPLAFVDAGNRLKVEIALQPVAVPAVEPVAQAEIDAQLVWRKTRVEFSAAPLAEVVRVLNEHNRQDIEIADRVLESVSVSGLFVAEDLETFTTMLETGFEIRAAQVDGRIVLSRR